jgi:hypothetical protein
MMALTKREFRRLLSACAKLKDGPDNRCSNYGVNLINTVLDFQMLTSTVMTATEYFIETHGKCNHERLLQIVASYPDTKQGNLQLANFLWDNNHWTRAKFLRIVLQRFNELGVRGQKSLARWARSADFKQDVQGRFKTQEHSIGYALFLWLQLRTGVETVKPDVNVLKFVSEAIGRKVAGPEAVEALMAVAGKLGRSPSRLDAAIWEYQRTKPRLKRMERRKALPYMANIRTLYPVLLGLAGYEPGGSNPAGRASTSTS